MLTPQMRIPVFFLHPSRPDPHHMHAYMQQTPNQASSSQSIHLLTAKETIALSPLDVNDIS